MWAASCGWARGEDPRRADDDISIADVGWESYLGGGEPNRGPRGQEWMRGDVRDAAGGA